MSRTRLFPEVQERYRETELLQSLSIACTRNEAGRHFTEWLNGADELEDMGLIAIHRPIHEATGTPYSQECWSLEVTEDGQYAVETWSLPM